jgi:hypothetical protein
MSERLAAAVRDARGEDQTWYLASQVLRGELAWAHGPKFAEHARDFFHEVTRTANEASKVNPDLYTEALIDGVYGWALCAADNPNERDHFQRLLQTLRDLWSRECACHLQARLALLEGYGAYKDAHYTQAVAHLTRVLDFPAAPSLAFIAQLIMAECALAQNDTASAQGLLEDCDELVSHGLEHGNVLAWLPRLPHVAGVMGQVEQWNWPRESKPANRMMTGGPRPRRPESALKIHAFGNGQVIVHGHEVDFGGTNARIALGVLTYIAMRQGGVDVESVQFDLFPKLSTDSTLQKAAGLARQILGDKRLLIQVNKVFATPPDTWLDVHGYRTRFLVARDADERTRFDLLTAAIPLYRGPFLQGVNDMPWVKARRREYQEAQGWLLYWLGYEWLRRDKPFNARDALLEALRVDPLSEAALEALVRLYKHELKSHAHAVELIRTHTEHMRQVYGTSGPEIGTLQARLETASPEDITAAYAVVGLRATRPEPAPDTLLTAPSPESGSHFLLDSGFASGEAS